MAGIDNNTVLYLRGDSFSDLSLYNKTLSNNGCIIEDKSIKINAGNYINIDYDSNLLDVGTGDFTVSFNFKPINQMTNHFIIAHQWANNNTGYAWGMRIYNNQLMLLVNSGSESVTYYSSDSIQLNSFAHYELCRKNGLVMVFINGKKIASFNYTGSLLSSTNRYISIGKIVRGTIGNLEGFLNNVFISKKCLHTEDFTPPTQPYNSIDINKTNQTDTHINLTVTKLGQEVINKVEVLQADTIKETYIDNFDSISYLVDKSLCEIGNNDILIRVTYDDEYTEEKVITYKHTIPPLPLETPLLDTVERVKVLTKSKQNEKNMLSSILTSKNVEVSEEDKMSDLIGKVDLLGEYDDGKTWLYRKGEFSSLYNYNILQDGGNGIAYSSVNSNNVMLKIVTNTNTYKYTGLSCSNKIDLTNYSALYVKVIYNEFTNASSVLESGIFIRTNNDLNGGNKVASAENRSPSLNEETIIKLDVSNLNSLYNLQFVIGAYMQNATIEAEIHEMWLE